MVSCYSFCQGGSVKLKEQDAVCFCGWVTEVSAFLKLLVCVTVNLLVTPNDYLLAVGGLFT